jgi:hypothetical protein
MRFKPGTIVMFHRPPSATYAQIVDVDSSNLAILVKCYPRIDYARLIQNKLTSQTALYPKMDKFYSPPEVPFQSIPDWPIHAASMIIWNESVDCLEWDEGLFLGQFQYVKVSPDELSIPPNVPDSELSRFAGGMADFERQNPAFIAEFLGEKPNSVDLSDIVLHLGRIQIESAAQFLDKPEVVDRGTNPIFAVKEVIPIAESSTDSGVRFVGPGHLITLLHDDLQETPSEISIKKVRKSVDRSPPTQIFRVKPRDPVAEKSPSSESDSEYIERLFGQGPGQSAPRSPGRRGNPPATGSWSDDDTVKIVHRPKKRRTRVIDEVICGKFATSSSDTT